MRISDWSSDVCSSDLHPTDRIVHRSEPLLELPANPLSTNLDLGSALVVEMLMEGGAMGNLAQAMHEGEMKDIRTLVGAGMAWSLNGVAGMTEKPLLSVPRGRTVVVDFRNDTRWPHAMHFHGHHFKVLERDGKPTEHETWKDTVLIAQQKAAKIASVETGTANV